jgi:DNA-binding transcriptional LysR family regulator
MLDARRLEVLIAVRRTGSLSAAAAALSFVPSAVSYHLRGLEQEVGAPLTRRVGRGIVLTEAGHLLAEHGDAVLERIARAEAALSELHGLEGGRLRVAAFPSAGATVVAGALAEFARQHPAVALTLDEAEPAASLPALRRGEVDLAVIYRYETGPVPPDPDLAFELLLRDDLRVAVAADHPAARSPRVALRELAGAPWIAGHPGSPATELTIQACRGAGFEPDIRFATEDYLVTLRLAAGGLGIALVPTLAAAGLDEDVVLVPVDCELFRSVFAVRRADSRSAAARAMGELLAEAGRNAARTDVGSL